MVKKADFCPKNRTFLEYDASSPGVAPLTCVLGRLAPPRSPRDTYLAELTPDAGFRTGGRCTKSSRAHPAWAATALVSSRVAWVVLEWVFLSSGGLA